MIKTYSLKKDGNTNLSEHFKVKEFACKDGSDTILIDESLITLLEKIRSYFNKPITITSGYRTKTYNAKTSQATNSKHCLGQACDIKVSGVDPLVVALYCELSLMQGMGGIGYYKANAFTHIDTRDTATRWVQPKGESTYKTVDKIATNV